MGNLYITDNINKAKAEAEAKKLTDAAKQSALNKPKVSTNTNSLSTPKQALPPPPPTPPTDVPSIVQVQGRDAIKKEFAKIGFVFNSDTTAMYGKNGIQSGLLDRGDSWQVSTKVWGGYVQDIYENCITVIWGRDMAWSNLIYLDYAMETPGSVFKSPQIEAFVQDGNLLFPVVLTLLKFV